MRRHPNGFALLFALSFVLLLPTVAHAAPLGVTGFFGNPGAAGETTGGRFAAATDAGVNSISSPEGVAVNETTGDVYVADTNNHRIQRFDADGDFEWALGLDVIAKGKPGNQPQNEAQRIALGGSPTGGTFRLGDPSTGQTATATIPYNASAEQVRLALEGVAGGIQPGDIVVTVAPGGNAGGEAGVHGGPWLVEFTGQLADVNLVPIAAPAPGLTPPGGKSVNVSTLVEGAGVVEKCTVAADCKGGIPFRGTQNVRFISAFAPGAGVLFPSSIGINQASGDLYVGDRGFVRIQQLDAEGNFIRAWGADVVASGPAQADETQRLTVAASSGQYKLTYHSTQGRGFLVKNSTIVNRVTTLVGSFAAGEAIVGPGIPEGTTITAVGSDSLTLSNPATTDSSSSMATFTAGPSSTSADIEWSESAAGLEAKLVAMAGIGAGSVSVSGGPGDAGGSAPYLISFSGALANANLAPLAVSAGTTPLTGGAGAAIATFNDGAEGFEVCEAAANCTRGDEAGGVVNGGTMSFNAARYLALAPLGAPNAGNVIIGELSGPFGAYARLQEFSPSGQFVRAIGWNVVASGPGNTGTTFEVCRASVLDICGGGITGSGSGQFEGEPGQPNIRVAVNTTGAIYTVESSANFRVQKFTPAPGGGLTPSLFCPSIGGAETLCGTSESSSPIEIAIDPVDDDIYVVKAFEAGQGTPPATSPERRLLEFDAAGTLLETHLVGNGLTSVNGLALQAGGEVGYLTTASPKPGVSILGPPVPPSASIEPTTAVTSSCATLRGTVNPNGGGAQLQTFYRFEYRPTGTGEWAKAPNPDGDAGFGEAPVSVEETVCDLQPKRAYEARLLAIKGGAPVISTGTGDFTTDPAPPTVETFNAFYDANDSELVLRGTVNPNNTAATYYFQYGTAPCSSNPCTSLPEAENAPAGDGGAPLLVSRRVADLEPATTYHFRLVADNGVETSPGVTEAAGAELTLTTPADSSSCPNEAVPSGLSARLPECRAFEWVSNGDSWGSGIGGSIGSIAEDGERAQFTAQAFGQPEGLPSPSTPYVAERTDTGWEVHSVAPKPDLASGSPLGNRWMVAADLGSALWPQSSIGQRLRDEVRWGTVGIDGSEDFATEMLAPVKRSGSGSDVDEYSLVGSSADLSSLVFTFQSESEGTSVALLAGEPLLGGFDARFLSNLYLVDDGALDIVNRGGASTSENPLGLIGGACGAGLGGSVARGEAEGPVLGSAVSADGAVVHFSIRKGSAPAGSTCNTTNPKRLYKRIDAATTVEVSACAKSSPANCTDAGDDRYRGASRDGEVSFFVSPRPLTDSDSDSTEDLYAYDESLPPAERLIQASAGEAVAIDHPAIGAGAQVQNMLVNSADGSRAYFVAKGRLTAEAIKGRENLYVFERSPEHPNGRIEYVGELASGEANAGFRTHALPGGEGGVGRLLLLTSAARLAREDLDSARDLYRYDDESGEIRCLSCMGAEAGGDVTIASRVSEVSWSNAEQRARPASADGDSVVFTTAESLVGEDTNGARDAYLWREGSLSLLSPGTEAAGITQEAAISPDGRDVFFITRSGMVGADTNNGLDLYDARIGGGFAEAPVPDPCASGEACQGPLSAPPPSQSPASVNFAGPGNPKAPTKCRKGKVRQKGKCVKKAKKASKGKSKKHGKRASDNRGGKR